MDTNCNNTISINSIFENHFNKFIKDNSIGDFFEKFANKYSECNVSSDKDISKDSSRYNEKSVRTYYDENGRLLRYVNSNGTERIFQYDDANKKVICVGKDVFDYGDIVKANTNALVFEISEEWTDELEDGVFDYLAKTNQLSRIV